MKEVIDEYGGVIVLSIVASMCLIMFCNLWFGSGAMVSNLATTVFSTSTDDAYMTSTSNKDAAGNTMYIVKSDGSTKDEKQYETALTSEGIANRKEPVLYGVGSQNETSQLLVYNSKPETIYNSTDLIWAEDADGVEIHNSASINDVDSNNYYDDYKTGYFRILSISQGNGNELISNCADINSIAYVNKTYANKTGGAGAGSTTSGNTFNIQTPSGDPWLDYDIDNQTWIFYKSGTYCFRVFVCDSQGKSMTGTVYISVAKNITQNSGTGSSAGAH